MELIQINKDNLKYGHETFEEAKEFGTEKYGRGNFIIDNTAYGYRAKKNDIRALINLERNFVYKEEKAKDIVFFRVEKKNDIRYYIFNDKNNKEIKYSLLLVRQY